MECDGLGLVYVSSVAKELIFQISAGSAVNKTSSAGLGGFVE